MTGTTNGAWPGRALPTIEASEQLYRRASGLIPAGTQTLAKGPTQYVGGVCPKYLARGKGARVWDVDGNEYLDMTMAVGPLVLGYAYEPVDAAIRAQLERGITFSLMHPLEVEVAELVHELVPNADMVRFSKTGADVTSAAVRLARAFTGRERVLCSGYHGWHDWHIGTSARPKGVPDASRALVRAVPHADLEQLIERIDESVACVILEPVIFEDPGRELLVELRRACEREGALLVFDEMWTGFRLALGGAQQHYGVTADLACFSKAVANGMPLSVLTGRKEVMRLLSDEVFFFTTFGGEALSLAAAHATLNVLRHEGVCGVLSERGRRLKRAYAELTRERGLGYTRLVGTDARTLVVFDAEVADPLEQKSLMQQELLRDGVLWAGFNNLSYSHTDAELDHLIRAYGRALEVLDDAVRHGDLRSQIRGEPVRPLFRSVR